MSVKYKFIAVFQVEYEYTHVWSLFIDKIRFLGVKPEKPILLSFESRSLWVEAFSTANIYDTIFYLSNLVIWGLLSGYLLFKKILDEKKIDNNKISNIFLLLVTVGFGILYLLIVRLNVFISFFLSVLTGYVAVVKFPKTFKSLLISILLITISWEMYEMTNYEKRGFKNLIFERYLLPKKNTSKVPNFAFTDLIAWIQKSTNRDDAFLTSFETGPMILLSTDRPIINHSKFETSTVRNKFKEFIFTFYDKDEEKFYGLCKKYNASYFLYQPYLLFDKSSESKRYQANSLYLHKDNLCFRFHFYPESFKHFKLVYQNMSFRVYKAIKNNLITYRTYNPSYIALYDINIFNQSATDKYFNDEIVSSIIEKYNKGTEWFLQGCRFAANEEYDETIKCNISGLEEGYPEYRFYSEIGNIYALKKEYKKAIPYLEKAVKLAPEESDLRLTLAQVYYLMGEIKKSLKEAEKLLENNPENYKALLIINTIKDKKIGATR